MKKRKILCLWLLLAAMLAGLCGCGGKKATGYEVLAKLDSEEFTVAFRSGDPTCDIVTAAMQEMAAEGLFSRLSSQYLGDDYSRIEGKAGALGDLPEGWKNGRRLLVGVQDGVAPLCWLNDDGTFTGLIPDLVDALAQKTGWNVVYVAIKPENVGIELASGNVDCAWLPAAFGNSDDYSCSPVWMENSHLLVVLKGSGIGNIKKLKNCNVGLTDSTSEAALKSNTKIFDTLTIWTYNDIRSCFNALAAGTCDAVVIDSIVSSHYIMG